MRKHYYIGIANTFHDPAIAIIDGDGKVLFAEAAERRYQVKRAIGCPPDNIVWAEEIIKKYCPDHADHTVSKSWSDNSIRGERWLSQLGIIRFDLNVTVKKILLRSAGQNADVFNRAIWFIKNKLAVRMNAGSSIERIVRDAAMSENVITKGYDHHLSHAGYASYCAPFDDAICLVVDGGGEGGCISVFKYADGTITFLEEQKNSIDLNLGIFYSDLTHACGFDPMKGEEWKVMGLAAYGSFNEELHRLFMSMFYVNGTSLKFCKDRTVPRKIFKKMHGQLVADSGNFSLKADIAYNGQRAYSQWMNELIANIHKKYPSDNLILTGGCALNSSHNGEILDKTPFKNLYVPSAPADDGCALGVALLAYYADHPHKKSLHKNISPYLGTEIADEQIQHFLRFSGHQKVRKLVDDKYDTVGRLLADGKIVGWVQGKAEFGPRALGNRSILADPRKKEIKDIINDRVKFREEFRPFAPSILHEYGNEYFEHYQESHYMERTLKFRSEVIDKVPGVVHEDGTGRLQSVKEEWNPELYRLIKAFNNITGIPVLLNTSFNIMGRPIIHTIEDAISTFFTTGIDALVINDHLIEK